MNGRRESRKSVLVAQDDDDDILIIQFLYIFYTREISVNSIMLKCSNLENKVISCSV